jgi:fatty acid desaturase
MSTPFRHPLTPDTQQRRRAGQKCAPTPIRLATIALGALVFLLWPQPTVAVIVVLLIVAGLALTLEILGHPVGHLADTVTAHGSAAGRIDAVAMQAVSRR